MDIKDINKSVIDTISNRFLNQRKTVRDKIGLVTLGLIKSGSCSITDIANQIGTIEKKNTFHANEIKVVRLLQTKTFQIDDKLWRSHVGIVFDLLKEVEVIQEGSYIPINVDYTSSTDEFLILSASIPYGTRYIPLYFSMRKYPKKKGAINMKFLESAFIKALKHILPDNYQYVIVADRGFGNIRFINLCEATEFKYIIRIGDNITYYENQLGDKKYVSNLKENKDLQELYITVNKKRVRLVNTNKSNNIWHIVTNIDERSFEEIVNQYGSRFKIEKMFQDEKSSGFNIENSRIKKYDRFKKLYYLITLAQSFLVFIGEYINENVETVKKRFQLHTEIVSVFSN
jgi:hypothetical protein